MVSKSRYLAAIAGLLVGQGTNAPVSPMSALGKGTLVVPCIINREQSGRDRIPRFDRLEFNQNTLAFCTVYLRDSSLSMK